MADSIFTLKREARREPFMFRLGEKEFTLPHVADVDQFELAELITRPGDTDLTYMTGWFELYLGEQLDAFRELKPTRSEMTRIYEEYLAFTRTDDGDTEGESGASST
jgi:hypothetical protein